MKNRPVGVELFHMDRPTDRLTDRRTDRYYEANNRSSQFCECALNAYFYLFSRNENTCRFKEANKHKHLIIFIVAPCILKIHLLSHTNKCTNYIIYYLKSVLIIDKHFHTFIAPTCFDISHVILRKHSCS
jgi:hypothetical protein